MSGGQHSVIWNGKDNNGKSVSSGVYFFKLKTENLRKLKGWFYWNKKVLFLADKLNLSIQLCPQVLPPFIPPFKGGFYCKGDYS